MMILKIYLVGMLLFVFGFGIYALITEGTSSIGEFIITLLLNVWLFPILFLHRLIKPRLHKLVLKKLQKDFITLHLNKWIKDYSELINGKGKDIYAYLINLTSNWIEIDLEYLNDEN